MTFINYSVSSSTDLFSTFYHLSHSTSTLCPAPTHIVLPSTSLSINFICSIIGFFFDPPEYSISGCSSLDQVKHMSELSHSPSACTISNSKCLDLYNSSSMTVHIFYDSTLGVLVSFWLPYHLCNYY